MPPFVVDVPAPVRLLVLVLLLHVLLLPVLLLFVVQPWLSPRLSAVAAISNPGGDP